MSLDHSLVGAPGEPTPRSWTSTDTLLYALGVRAGAEDPLTEALFQTTTEDGTVVIDRGVATFS
jgi:hypothetical protein